MATTAASDDRIAPSAARTFSELCAGLPVPPGFVVGAATYADFCTRTGLRERIEAELDAVDVDGPDALETASDCVRVVVLAEPFPDDIAQAITAAYRQLVADGEFSGCRLHRRAGTACTGARSEHIDLWPGAICTPGARGGAERRLLLEATRTTQGARS